MAQTLIAVRTLERSGDGLRPIGVKGVAYIVWISPDGKGRWWFRFNILGGNPTASDTCNLEAAQYIFGYDTIEEKFGRKFTYVRQTPGDEEEIT